jgi:hypothetical protein
MGEIYGKWVWCRTPDKDYLGALSWANGLITVVAITIKVKERDSWEFETPTAQEDLLAFRTAETQRALARFRSMFSLEISVPLSIYRSTNHPSFGRVSLFAQIIVRSNSWSADKLTLGNDDPDGAYKDPHILIIRYFSSKPLSTPLSVDYSC